MFENILGNEPIKKYFERALRGNTLPQTLLFVGLPGIGKAMFAKALASKLADPLDLHLLTPEGKSGLYAIDTLREMMDKEREPPYGALGKVFILEDMERMQPAAANALLKTLEEPTPSTTFILLTSTEKQILPTILSRCSTIQFKPLTPEEIASKGIERHIAELAGGSLGRALELTQEPELEEQRKLLFQILRDKPSYPVKMAVLEKITSFAKEEEDPIKSNRRAERLFAYILMWHRDQHVKHLGQGKPFFPDEPAVVPIALHKVEKAIDEARFAFNRNVKLSYCLYKVFNI